MGVIMSDDKWSVEQREGVISILFSEGTETPVYLHLTLAAAEKLSDEIDVAIAEGRREVIRNG